MKLKINSLIFFLLLASCASKLDLQDDDILKRYELGMKYFEKEKYLKAESEFNYLILNNPGSKLALDAQYYMAESMFYQEKYLESIVEYERYSRFSDDNVKIERADFKSCEASYQLSNEFLHDQGSAAELMDKLQFFIEKYPSSKFNSDIEFFFQEIRSRLAKKEYETGRLYLKLEEYNSALIYFNEVISIYYDTIYSDLARIEIVFTYLLRKKPKDAKLKLDSFSNKFIDYENYKIAEKLIQDMRSGELNLSNYIRLYK